MRGKEHATFGLATSVTYAALLASEAGTPEKAIFVGSAVLGALLPDVDTDTVVSNELLWPVKKVLGALGIKHRTLTHDALLWCAVAVAAYMSENPILWGLMFGYVGHIFLDSLTKMGVCFGYFFNTKAPAMVHLLPKPLRTTGRGSAILANALSLSAIAIAIVIKTKA